MLIYFSVVLLLVNAYMLAKKYIPALRRSLSSGLIRMGRGISPIIESSRQEGLEQKINTVPGIKREGAISEDVRVQIVKLYADGEKVRNIAAKFKIGESTADRIVHDSGIRKKIGKQIKKVDSKIIMLALEKHKNGKTINSIARELGVSVGSVHKYVKIGYQKSPDEKDGDLSVAQPRKPRGRRSSISLAQKENIVKMYHDGVHVDEIARLHNVKRSRVYGITRRVIGKGVRPIVYSDGSKSPRKKYYRKNHISSSDDIKEMYELYKKNVPVPEIAKKFSMSTSAVYGYFSNIPEHKNGIRYGHRPIDEAEKEKIVKRYIEGNVTISNLAGIFKRDEQKIRRIIGEYNDRQEKSAQQKKLTIAQGNIHESIERLKEIHARGR